MAHRGQKAPVPAPASGKRIVKRIAEELSSDPRLKTSNPKVELRHGRLVLSGTAASSEAKAAAELDARMIAGACFIANHIRVLREHEDRPATDGTILERVIRTLKEDPEVDASAIEISVRGGVVLLEGAVDAVWKKPRIDELVFPLPGVVDVMDHLAVVPSHQVQDRVIAEEIEHKMDQAGLDMHRIDLRVTGGLVSLEGTVPNWAALITSHDAAQYTRGVRGVVNDLVIPVEKAL